MKNSLNTLTEIIDFINYLGDKAMESFNNIKINDMTPETAWEIARKIVYIDRIGGFTSKEFNEIFDGLGRAEVMKLDVYTVKEYIDDYNKKKND